jgi:hypothetical protein
MNDYIRTGQNQYTGNGVWAGTTSGTGGWGWSVAQPTYQQQWYQTYGASNFKVAERSDAQQLNEGWDADENPS